MVSSMLCSLPILGADVQQPGPVVPSAFPPEEGAFCPVISNLPQLLWPFSNNETIWISALMLMHFMSFGFPDSIPAYPGILTVFFRQPCLHPPSLSFLSAWTLPLLPQGPCTILAQHSAHQNRQFCSRKAVLEDHQPLLIWVVIVWTTSHFWGDISFGKDVILTVATSRDRDLLKIG